MDPRLTDALAGVDARPTIANYLQAARELRALDLPLSPVRVALLATFTVDQLVPFLTVEGARCGFAVETYVAPFDSVRQELLDPKSGCARFTPGIVFILQTLDGVCPPLARGWLALDDEGRASLETAVAPELFASVRAFRERSAAAVIVGNFARPRHAPLGIYEAMAPASPSATVDALNARLADEARRIAGVHVLDFDRVCAEVGYAHALDERMWLLARAPLSASLLPVLARRQATFVQAVAGAPRKCLVLDLDNTLWGGVVGEAGVAGIQLGHSYPGHAYRRFQEQLLELHHRGVLLALNSKNNPADVDEVFRTHADMVLRREHFSSVRINWRDKPANMREIAQELNIGLDSLVFFDDNPAERDLMRQMLPEVLTLEVPREPERFAGVLAERAPFDRLSLTDEDRRRGTMYRGQARRETLRAGAATLDEFLAGLQMTVRIRPAEPFTVPRVLDLIQKTNQFNLTTRRHSASALDRFLADGGAAVFTMQVLDRFGDEGIVGVAIVQRRGQAAEIDTFLLSCRVIGRTVETAFLAFLAEWARQRGLATLEGEFLPTAKNTPAADFYARHGFTEVGEGRWRLVLDQASLAWPSYIVREDSTPEAAATAQR